MNGLLVYSMNPSLYTGKQDWEEFIFKEKTIAATVLWSSTFNYLSIRTRPGGRSCCWP